MIINTAMLIHITKHSKYILVIIVYVIKKTHIILNQNRV